MGVFFTNYQVHTGDAEACAKAVAGVIRSRALVSDANAGWVSVYDETSESQNENELERVAKGLSSKMATEVLALLLHDSDVFIYLLYRNGKLLDRFNSRPDYFGSVEPAEHKKWEGEFSKLLPIAATGTTVKKIQQLVDEKRVFEEELARGFAELMGLNPERACTGFRYLAEGEHGFLVVHGKGHSAVDSALAASAESGDLEGVKSALEKGASPSGQSSYGESLLVNAVRRGRTEIAAALLEAGADPFVNPKADAVWAVAAFGNREILNLLLKQPTEKLRPSLPPALMTAVMSGHADLVEDLLKAGADPNVPNQETGSTPLMMACSRGMELISEALTGRRSTKPSDWVAMVAALVRAGADVNARDNNGMTPLLLARAGGQKEIAEILLQAGADPNVKPGAQFLKMVEMLRAKGLGGGGEGAQLGHLDPRVRDMLLNELMKCRKK